MKKSVQKFTSNLKPSLQKIGEKKFQSKTTTLDKFFGNFGEIS